MEHLNGLAVAFREGDRDQRFDAARRSRIPREGEDQPAVRHDLAVNTAEPALYPLLDDFIIAR